MRSLADLGWGMVVWGFYFFAVVLPLGESHPRPLVWLFGAGGLLVLLFGENDGRGAWRGVCRGLARLPLTLLNGIGSFSDVVSYIRLFAVGLATTEVAVAFNRMAASVGWDTIPRILGFSLIVLTGHTLNLMNVLRGAADSSDPVVNFLAGLLGGLAMGASAWMQGRAGAAAADALTSTGKGFGNYLMVLGIIETVALFVMVFLMTAIR